MVWAAISLDYIYIVLCVVFLSLMFGALSVHGKKRIGVLAVASISALMPMTYQSFSSSYTRQQSIAALETLVATDSVISGAAAPWDFLGLRRRIIFANCAYANSLDGIPVKVDYVMVASGVPNCPISADYESVMKFSIFNPVNDPSYTNRWRKTSRDWMFYYDYVLLRKWR